MIDTAKLKSKAYIRFIDTKANESITLSMLFDAGWDAGYAEAKKRIEWLGDDVARLRAAHVEAEEVRQRQVFEMQKYRARIDALEAENRRLMEALETIAKPVPEYCSSREALEDCEEIATAALNHGIKKDGG